ncbi:tRNA 2-thiouridine(34) synthase MnmA [bacterium]|nr:tRNA 2-thiouridine(34) synthase MnmA [bacterium]|tara:strand:+ start:817 stop:1938 length:1122 start_codon:yes stop_codon:yes gene_type:complete
MKVELNSIGIQKKPSDTTIVVAMSGGVDSSTVAGMMKKEGYNVIGITLKLYDGSKEVAKSKQCCSGQDIIDAKRVANKLGIEHKILYYQDKFKQGVIDNFVESYLKGETPIPCVQCNQTVKFKDLLEVSKDLKADALVTGHYVKSVTKNNSTNMYRAIDESRDQSYFLFNTTKKQLNYLRFPLGKILKDKTREIAKELDLNVAEKPDSQDICFVPNGDYASVIQKFNPGSFQKGNIKNLDGKVVGVHDGIINFTIGQRKRIKVSDKHALYVIRIDSKKNEIVVGPKEKLGKQTISLRDINLLTDKDDFKYKILVKVRSTGKLLDAKINFFSNDKAIVTLEKLEYGISPGQACVFYNKDKFGYKVLGGGWIIEN